MRERQSLEQKQELRGVVPEGASRLLYADHVVGRGVELYEAACGMDLEGVVGKVARGRYCCGEGMTSWVKVRNAGYSQMRGRREQFALFRHFEWR